MISAVFGILLGFIAGYLAHEVVVARQAPRFQPSAGGTSGGTAGVAQNGMPGGGAATGGGPMGGQPPAAVPQQPDGQAVQQEMQQLGEYLRQNPDDPQAIRRLADLNFEQGLWGPARDLYDRYLQLRPGDPDVTSDLGVTYRGLRQFDKALELFDQAQQMSPDHWQSRFNEVIVLGIDLKKYDQAQAVLTELQRLQPGNPNVAQLAAELDKQRNAA